jgi:glycosyltransferase involved in cell wall biosynthesis
MNRLAVVTTHPIQYYAPVFKLLNERGKISLTVFYTAGKNKDGYDPGFDQEVEWDIPLLEGYSYEWAENTAKKPGSHHFNGVITPGLIGQIDALRPDAILVIGWSYHSHLRVIRHYKNKIPVYFRGDSTLLDVEGTMRRWFRTLALRWVYSHIDHAFYTGSNNHAYFKKYGVRDEALSFAPHAVDNDRFGADRTSEARRLRLDLGIADGDIVVLFAGKLEEKKAPVLLLESFLNIGRPDLHILFTGNGRLENTLRQIAGKRENIHFLPFQNQSGMPVVYQCCDLFCLPSKGPGETWGLAVNEAMACGKAVLVSDKVGCAADLVSQNNGAIFTSGNKGGLVSALTTLTQCKATLIKLGNNSKNNIKDWNFEHIAETIENQLIYETNRPD